MNESWECPARSRDGLHTYLTFGLSVEFGYRETFFSVG